MSTGLGGGGGGGSATPLNSTLPIKNDVHYFVDKDKQEWLRSGVISKDLERFPDAEVSPYMEYTPMTYVEYETPSGFGTFKTTKNHFGHINTQTISTEGDLMWYASGSTGDIVEAHLDGTLTGRKHLVGQRLQAIAYNTVRKSIISWTTIGDVSETVIETGEVVRSLTKIDWSKYLVAGSTFAGSTPRNVSFDGTYYIFSFGRDSKLTLYYFDEDLNFIKQADLIPSSTNATQYMMTGLEFDPVSKLIFVLYQHLVSGTQQYVKVYDYNLNSLYTFVGISASENTTIGVVQYAPMYVRDYGLLFIRGNKGTITFKTNNTVYYPLLKTATIRPDSETMFTDSGKFGYSFNPTKKTLFQYNGQVNYIFSTGYNYTLSELGTVYDFCGGSDGKLWFLCSDSIAREYTTTGTATGKTFTVGVDSRAMVTDKENIYTISYNITPVKVTKWDFEGNKVEEFERPSMYKTHTKDHHLAFNGELWVAVIAGYDCIYLNKDFHYVGNENYITTVNYFRSAWPNGYSILGNIVYADGANLYMSSAPGRSFVPTVGLAKASVDQATSLPIYMRVK